MFRKLLFVLFLCICLFVPDLVVSADNTYNFIPKTFEIMSQSPTSEVKARGYFSENSGRYIAQILQDTLTSSSSYGVIGRYFRFRYRDSSGLSVLYDTDAYLSLDATVAYLDSSSVPADITLSIYFYNNSGSQLYALTVSEDYYTYEPDETGFGITINSVPISVPGGTYTICVCLKFTQDYILGTENIGIYIESTSLDFLSESLDASILESAIADSTDQITDSIDSAADQAHTDAEEQKGLLSSIISGISSIGDFLAEFSSNVVNGFLDLIDAVLSLPQTLIDLFLDAMKYLFVPSDDYFSNTLTDLQDFMQDHLGILFLPVTLLQNIIDLVTTTPTSFSLTIPELKIMGYTFFSETTFYINYKLTYFRIDSGGSKKFYYLSESDFGSTILTCIHLLGDLILTSSLLKYIYSVIRRWGITDSAVDTGGGSD